MTAATTSLTWNTRFAVRTQSEGSDALAAILALSGRTDIISFAGGLPAPETLPDEQLGVRLRDILASGDSSALQYAPVKGLPGPLGYIGDRLAASEGRRPDGAELMITSGCIEALELLGKTFLDAGDVVIVEAPTYMGATMGFRSFGADVVEVPVDQDGVQIDLLERAFAAHRPKLFYTVPDYQNPTGLSLSATRRPELVELARRHGVVVVEDVTYRELGFGASRLPSLWSLDPDVVVQIGTFSKTFFPGVRLGWAAGPQDVIAQMILAKQNTDQCAGALGQRLLEEYGRSGELDRQIGRAQSFYLRRRDAMMAALHEHMPEGVTWTRPEGGFVTWLTLPERADTMLLAERAMDQAVAFVPGPIFYADRRAGRNNLRLSYSLVSEDQIQEGIRRLGLLLRHNLPEG